MNEKPQKRLVGLIEYLETVGEKALGYACGGTLASVSIVLLLWSVFGIIVGAIHIYSRNLEYAIFYWAGSAVVAGMGMVARWFAKALFKEAKKIAPVVLRTKAAQNQLSDAESLVRASDLPPSHQQAELLRAAQPGQEMPPEELLRATQGNKPYE